MILDFIQTKAWSAPALTAPIMWGAGTTTVSNITLTWADLTWTYISDWWSPVTATWFVVYPAGNPSTVIWGLNVLQFPDWTLPSPITATASGLTSNTNYCFKPYATNAVGTSYGVEVCFFTSNTWLPPSTELYTANWSTGGTRLWKVALWWFTYGDWNLSADVNCVGINNTWTFAYVWTNSWIRKVNTSSGAFTVLSTWYLALDCVQSANSVWFTDTTNSRIIHVDMNTDVISVLATVGSTSLFLTKKGWFIYVSDYSAWVIRKINISSWSIVATLSWITNVYCMTIENGFLYATRYDNHHIYKVDLLSFSLTSTITTWVSNSYQDICAWVWYIIFSSQSWNIWKYNTITNLREYNLTSTGTRDAIYLDASWDYFYTSTTTQLQKRNISNWLVTSSVWWMSDASQWIVVYPYYDFTI